MIVLFFQHSLCPLEAEDAARSAADFQGMSAGGDCSSPNPATGLLSCRGEVGDSIPSVSTPPTHTHTRTVRTHLPELSPREEMGKRSVL